MSSILITGGTGFLGQKLIPTLLSQHDHITLYSRNAQKAIAAYNGAIDAVTSFTDLALKPSFDVIINLAGESINQGRWTKEQKERLCQSRINLTDSLVDYCHSHPPRHFLQASAIGYYGAQTSPPWPVVTENGPKGSGFLADLSNAWEQSALKLDHDQTQLTIMRFAPIFDADGGAFPLIRLPYLFYAGSRIGNGLQPFPWVHRDDVVGAILHILRKEKEAAPIYNIVAPELIRQRQSVAIIHRYLGGFRPPLWLPKPFFRLVLGEKSELIIGGQFAYPKALRVENYDFLYPTLESALPTLF